MRRLFLLFCLFTMAVASAQTLDTGYSLRSVIDGDTIIVQKGNFRPKIRMLRIDTPEREEFGYRQATQALRNLFKEAKTIGLEFEEERADKYGRTLAYVYVNGKNVNVEMVRLGWSRFFDRFGRGKYESQFRGAEREARQARRGIWGRK